MAFTEIEIAQHQKTLETAFWSHRRPPLHLRDKIREGQRITDRSIELFFIRPAFQRPVEFIECSIARLQYVRSRDVWKIFWMRADGKWHSYPPFPETRSLAAALRVVGEDTNACFFG